MNNKTKGKLGELAAAALLAVKGYKILARNYAVRTGEIDIIARDKGYIVFIEVKTRLSVAKGEPREAVDYHKQQQIKNTARLYLLKNKLYGNDVRFDVIEVKSFRINHLKNAFM